MVLVAIKSLQHALAVGAIRRCDLKGMRQAVGIDADTPFDAGNPFPAVHPLVFGGVGVLDALRVNAMTGASAAHNIILLNLASTLRSHLHGSPCTEGNRKPAALKKRWN